MEQIKAKFENGKTTIEAVGFSGGTCEEATRFLETALGNPVAREHKPEFYEEQAAHLEIQQ